MATVAYEQASRIFDTSRPPAVNRVSLQIQDAEFLVLVGPSGSGKSTAMRMPAGLEPVDEGRILIDGQDVTDMRAHDRDVAMVFQSYALYPNMTARQNMAFALENLKVPKDEIQRKVEAAARMLGVTTVYVTHDQAEAMTMGDRVAVLKDGVLQQVDEPTHMYENPGNTFVAEFIGSPSITLLEGVRFAEGRAVLGEGHALDLGMPSDLAAKVTGDTVLVGVRPENWEIVSRNDADRDDQCVPLQVDIIENLGAEAFAYCTPLMTPDTTVAIRQKRIAVRLASAAGATIGETLWVRPRAGSCVFFDPRSEINLRYL